jgi:mRNA-degrading endonuclease toxin of MazEF toxin-antitoxin module
VDQLRAVDRRRLVRRLGVIDAATQDVLLRTLAAFFAP